MQVEKTAREVAKANGVHSNSASVGRRKFLEKGPEVFSDNSRSNLWMMPSSG